MLKTIAIDIGGSGGKAFVTDYDGKTLIVREIMRFANNPVYMGDAYCWDLPRLVHDVKHCLQAASGDGNAVSFGIDTWGASMGMLDARGQLLSLPRHYRDAEYAGIDQEVFKLLSRQAFFQRIGCSTEGNIALFQCYAQRLYAPEVFAAAKRVLMTADLIRYFLTDTAICEETLAGTGGLVEPYTRTRNDCDLELLGLGPERFPQPVRAGSIAGRLSSRVARELSEPRIAAIAVAGHDTASAVLTLPQETEDCFLILGTWGLMGVVTDRLIVTERALQRNCVNELNPEGKIRFLRNAPGMWIYDQCRAQWGVGHDQLLRDAENAPPFRAWIDVEDPMFHSPGDMPARIRAYLAATGQQDMASAGAMIRCVFESMACKYRQALEALREDTERPLRIIHAVGGGTHCPLLMKMIAAATGCEVRVGQYEASAVGNALMQLVALGELRNAREARELAQRSFATRTVFPPKEQAWEDAYARYRTIVGAL